MRHNDGRTQGDFSLEHGCIDDVHFIIWVDTTGHEHERVLASHLPDIDADPVEQETILQEQDHV